MNNQSDLRSHYTQLTFTYDEKLLSRVLSFIQAPHEYESFVVNQSEYNDLFRIRHDLVLSQFANVFNFKLDQKIGDLIEIKDELVKNQSPDIIKVDGKKIFLGELSIDHFPERAFKIKKTKYQYLIYILGKMGYTVDFKVAIFYDSGEIYADEVNFPARSQEIIKVCTRLINLCKSENPDLEISRLEVEEVDTSAIKLEPIRTTSSEIDQNDKMFINKIADIILGNMIKQPKGGLDEEGFVNNLRVLRKQYETQTNNPEDHKAVLKVPYFISDIVKRDTSKDIQLIQRHQIRSVDPNLIIGDTEDGKLFELKVIDKELLAREGPGASSFKDKPWYSDRRKRQKNFVVNPDMDFTELSTFLSSSHSYKHRYTSISDFLEKNSICRYLRIVELICREISINAMRRERKHKNRILITATDVSGVFLMLYPGAMLRAGEKNSTVWFKIIWTEDVRTLFLKLTQRTYKMGKLTSTRWLSITAKKLDHYLRAHDQVLMAYFSLLSTNKEMTIEQSVINDTSNTLALCTALWMEDLRQTSTVLQDFRYFIMQKLSMIPSYGKLMKKILIPIRSPVLYDCILNLFGFLRSDFNVVGKEEHLKSSEEVERFSKIIECRRPVTKGPKVGFQGLVNEMYLSMLFNKNEQEPTEDSFQILNKILEAEEDFKRQKEKGLVDYTGDDEKVLLEIMQSDLPGAYSSRAIELGSKLQLVSPHNSMGSSAPKIASNSLELNKPLSDFATLKSSSVPNEEFKRVKCAEAVVKLLNQGYTESFEVAKDNLDKRIEVQIFKKNQIGGTREISILDMVSRIKTNIVETYFRNMNKFDDREMLTEGTRKFEVMRENHKKTIGRFKFNINGDATRWAQSFHPPQFKYLISPHETPLKGYAQHIFKQFSEKKISIPKALVDQWLEKPDYFNGENKLLDKLKAQYLSGDKEVHNESNMCQGILHYTSSYLHICLLSFIEKVISVIFSRRHQTNVYMESQVSSDDYLITIHTDEKDNRSRAHIYRICRNVIWQCQRLFNVHDSAKTSVSQLIYEFNSCFAMNFNYLSPIIKFSLASVEPINTDSPSKMVSEGVNRVNQIIDNGGSIELAKIAHRFNSIYVEEIVDIKMRKIPFEYGVYPDSEMTTEIYMFGAEYHNFKLIEAYDSLTVSEKQLLCNNYRSVISDAIELAANYLYSEDKQPTKIRLSVAPSRKWLSLINSLPYNKEELLKIIVEEPELIFTRSRDVKTQLVKVCLKMYTSNVREAMRDTSPSIYYARYSAYKTAEAFLSFGEKKTYKECLFDLMSGPLLQKEVLSKRIQNYDDMLIVSRVTRPSYEVLKPRPHNFSKRYLTLRMREKVGFLKNSLLSVLGYKWFSDQVEPRDINQFERDWRMLEHHIPHLKSTFRGTIESYQEMLNVPKETATVLLIRELNKLMGLKSFQHKTLGYGSSTNNIIDTYFNIEYNNQFENKMYGDFMIQEQKEVVSRNVLNDLSSINSIFDFFMRFSDLKHFENFITNFGINGESIKSLLQKVYENLYYYYNDSYSRKKLLIILYSTNILDSHTLLKFATSSQIVWRQWIVEQTKVLDDNKEVKWRGDYTVKYSYNNSTILVSQVKGKTKIQFSKGPDWQRSIATCLKSYLSDFSMTSTDLEKLTGRGPFNLTERPLFVSQPGDMLFGFSMTHNVGISLFPQRYKLEVEKSRLSLCDQRGAIISVYMTVDPIFVNLRRIGDDVKVFGISMETLIRKQILLESFNPESLDPEEKIDPSILRFDIAPKEEVLELCGKMKVNLFESTEYSEPVVEMQINSVNIIDMMDDDDDFKMTEEELMGADEEKLLMDDDLTFSDLQMVKSLANYEVTFASKNRLDILPYLLYIKQNPNLTIKSIPQVVGTLKKQITQWQRNICIILLNKNLAKGVRIPLIDYNIFEEEEHEVFFDV